MRVVAILSGCWLATVLAAQTPAEPPKPADPAKQAPPAEADPLPPKKSAGKEAPPAKEPPPVPVPPKPAEVEGVRGLRPLARRLRALADAELPPGAGIWQMFSKPERIAGGAVASGKASATDEQLFAEAVKRLLDEPKLPDALALEDAGARDPELAALLLHPAGQLTPASLRRRNRLLLAAALPHDFQPLAFDIKTLSRDSVSLYPPAPGPEAADKQPGTAAKAKEPPKEVALAIKAPELRTKVRVFFEGFDPVLVSAAGKTLQVPNTGVLRYRLAGDGFGTAYPRKLEWSPAEAQDGKAEAELTWRPARRP